MKIEISANFKETVIGNIPADWNVFQLGDLMEKVIDNRGKTPPISKSGHELIETFQISMDRKYPDINNLKKQKYVSEDIYNSWFRSGHPQKGDILFSTVGASIPQWCFVPEHSEYCIAQNTIALRPSSKLISPEFLRSYFNNPIFKEQVNGIVITTAQPSIKVPHLLSLKIPVPPLKEQEKITEIISSIEDKKELNHNIVNNLEKLAGTLFKSWFTDFDFPDKNGKPYKSSGGKMIDSELGEIPEGWQIKLMTDFVDIGKGLSYKGSDLNESGKNVLVGLKCFERGGGFRADGTKRFAGEFKNQHTLKPGDLIVAMTDLTQGAEVLGKPAIVPNIKNAENIIASLDVSILRPKTSQISKAYLYTLFMRQETQDYLFGYSNGSTVLHLSIKGLNEFKLIIASDNVLQKFNSIIEPIFSQIQVLNSELQNLQTVRDSLLPRLMSGKIRVN